MKATMVALIFGCILTLVTSSGATTHAFVITLDPENVLILEPTNGMVLRPFVDPPDEQLGQAVLQLTYEPNGVRYLFNLVGITVALGSLNVGIQYEDGTIGVYNDLTAGSWALEDSDRIKRVTLECPSGGSCPSTEALRGMFRVQSLEIEPLPESVPPPPPVSASTDVRCSSGAVFRLTTGSGEGTCKVGNEKGTSTCFDPMGNNATVDCGADNGKGQCKETNGKGDCQEKKPPTDPKAPPDGGVPK